MLRYGWVQEWLVIVFTSIRVNHNSKFPRTITCATNSNDQELSTTKQQRATNQLGLRDRRTSKAEPPRTIAHHKEPQCVLCACFYYIPRGRSNSLWWPMQPDRRWLMVHAHWLVSEESFKQTDGDLWACSPIWPMALSLTDVQSIHGHVLRASSAIPLSLQ